MVLCGVHRYINDGKLNDAGSVHTRTKNNSIVCYISPYQLLIGNLKVREGSSMTYSAQDLAGEFSREISEFYAAS